MADLQTIDRVAAYLAKADELAEDMEAHGYGVVQTYALLAIAHMMMATRGRVIDHRGEQQR